MSTVHICKSEGCYYWVGNQIPQALWGIFSQPASPAANQGRRFEVPAHQTAHLPPVSSSRQLLLMLHNQMCIYSDTKAILRASGNANKCPRLSAPTGDSACSTHGAQTAEQMVAHRQGLFPHSARVGAGLSDRHAVCSQCGCVILTDTTPSSLLNPLTHTLDPLRFRRNSVF